MSVSHVQVLSTLPPVAVGPEEVGDLREALAGLVDPRRRRGVRHTLLTILLVAVVAVLAGAQNFREIGDDAADLPQELLARVRARWHPHRLRFLPPSAATIRRVVTALDATALDRVVYDWLSRRTGWTERDPAGQWRVAIDGKQIAGASRTGSPVRLFSALVHGQATTIAQVRVPDTTNETTQVAPLLDGIDVTGALITADAAHTQRDTCRLLVDDCGADYLLTIKGNQPGLRRAASDALLGRDPDRPAHLDIDHTRGHQVHRSVWVADATAIDWPHAAQVFLIRREIFDPLGARVHREFVFGVTSRDRRRLDPAGINIAARSHWEIENRQHWVRDVVFGEDAHTAYLGATPQVMATLRNLAISLIRHSGSNQIKRTTQRIRRNPVQALQLIGLD